MKKHKLFTFFMVMASIPTAVQACRCVREENALSERYKRAKYVFFAEISSTRLTSERSVVAEFRLIESFKGQSQHLAFIKTQAGGMAGSCGLVITAGDRFFLFSDESGVVSKCDGSHMSNSQNENTKILNLRKLKADKANNIDDIKIKN